MKRFFLALLLVGLYFGNFGANAQQAVQEDFQARFEQAWRLVDERYWGLDTDMWQAVRGEFAPQAANASDEAAFYAVLETMYEQLNDDHSVFVPPERVEEIRQQYGDLPCLGVFSYAQSPTWNDGDGELWQQLERRESYPSGVRSGVSNQLGQAVAYIDIPDLATGGIARDVRRAVTDLSPQVAAFVVDVRGNPGGRLVEMMQAAGVFTNGFLWRTITSWTLPMPYPAIGLAATDLPLVILTDGGVNSAAEGFAGALQASGRATVVGKTTAGNVEAVLPFCLRDGSQAWIATGVLAPLRGATWEGRGVVPDVDVPAGRAFAAALEHLKDTI